MVVDYNGEDKEGGKDVVVVAVVVVVVVETSMT